MSLREELEYMEQEFARKRHPDVQCVEERLDRQLTDYGFEDYREASGWVREWYERGETAEGIARILEGDEPYM